MRSEPRVFLRTIAQAIDERAPGMRTFRRLMRDGDGRPVLAVGLHPAAEAVAFVAAGEGRLVVSARTASAGAGYHVFVAELVRALGDELGIEWAAPDARAGVGDATGYFHGASRAAVEMHMLAWLRSVAERLLETGLSDAALSLARGHRFVVDAALATPMGPRGREWLEAVAAEPASGIDVFPWWEDGLGPRYHLGRALCRMWTELRWRPPISDEERRALKDVAGDLQAAWRAAPALEYPWREWQEVLGYLGQGGTIAEEVRVRAKEVRAAASLGYRRGDVRVQLPGSWSIRVPGALAEKHEEADAWHAWDHRREVRFRAVEVDSEDEAPALDEILETSEDAISLDGGIVRGRARVIREPVAGDVGQLRGVCAVPGKVAICTVAFTDPEDRAWAEETFRSIEHPASA